jgi:uncharacterized protein
MKVKGSAVDIIIPCTIWLLFIAGGLVGLLGSELRAAQSPQNLRKVPSKMELARPSEVVLRGILGQALEASYRGRLLHFIQDTQSEPISLFSPEAVARNYAGDWYGEHAGKWLVTASRTARRLGDEELAGRIRKIADYLIRLQESNGYLGTYAPGAPSRMTSPVVEENRTWDVWVHAYLILGFLELNRQYPQTQYLQAAKKIGDLCVQLFGSGPKSVAYMGNHLGLSGTILLDPIVQLYFETGEKRYLELGQRIIQQMEDRPGLQIISRSLQGMDLEQIGDGKIYQLCWNYLGVAGLYEATGQEDLLKAVKRAWQNIRDHHLTLGGGPWGGIAGHKEVFNAKDYFSPYGLVETCSTMSWLQLNRELLLLTGESQYADEIEKTIYNSLLGAQDPNGEDWCYFIFPNGRRNNTYYWACCKSSGALALEEISPLAYGKTDAGIAVNLYADGDWATRLPQTGHLKLSQTTDYPFSPDVTLKVEPERRSSFALDLRIPSWAAGAAVTVNGKALIGTISSGAYFRLSREWQPGDVVTLSLPLKLRLETKSQLLDHHGQEIFRIDYMAMSRGPLLYATGLIDGYKREDTLEVPKANTEALFSSCAAPIGSKGPAFQLNLPGLTPVVFVPYYEAGGRHDGAWHLSWIPVAWQ